MMTLKGLRGEVLVKDGRIAGAIPPSGQPNAIPFEIRGEHPATTRFPAWADVRAGNVNIRINPDICQPPWFRLCDCVMCAVERAHTVRALGSDEKMKMELGGTAFVFWPERIAGLDVVMIDTLERILKWNAVAPAP